MKTNYFKLKYFLIGIYLIAFSSQPLQAATKSQASDAKESLPGTLSSSKQNQFIHKSSKTIIAQTPTVQIRETNPNLDPQTGPGTPAPLTPPSPSMSTEQGSEAPMVPNPKITIDGQPIPPGGGSAAPQPILPRAVAPAVGDMSVSNIDTSPNYIDLGTKSRVPRLVLRQAPVKEVLSLLARQANLNIIFVDDAPLGAAPQGAAPAAPSVSQTVTIDLVDQPVGEVFNSVLLMSGLSANRRNNTIYVGAKLPDGARNLISRTIRLNQVKANNAATFLATQGAEVQQLVVPITEVRDPQTNRVIERREEAATLQSLTSQAGGEAGPTSPLLLAGLKASPDERLNHVTLVGEPRQVEIATSFLTQLDARRRQVAVNVKVIDVNLTNLQSNNSSFSFGFNDGFFVQDGGSAILNFGGLNPPSASETTGSRFYPTIVPLELPGGNGGFFDRQLGPFSDVTPGSTDATGRAAPYNRPNFGTNNNPFQPGVRNVDVDDKGKATYTFEAPRNFQYPNKFLLTLQAQIENRNAKILTDPTLVVQEGQEATVQLTQQVLTKITTSIDTAGGGSTRTVTPEITDAGLILRVNIDRIDDNGFVSLSVNPTISAPNNTISFSSDVNVANQLTLLNIRSLQSGLLRLQDGQTLILSGIIQESDRTTVTKVPILGDIPLLGALFRKTDNQTDRREVIILLTPKIIDEKAGFGYNYRPGREATEMLKEQGFTPGGGRP